ncbi:hypothetical protein GWK47_043849 [Chionoecetes opilio]|uniref:Uncharacterized protein n=1 Tax=Chionoecetes opilio TaxID=41210 RepID=A0A8J4Y7F3_CHIOP|nr:hypothetical protein GWK47_043849 [Chionoecetes opilio]
MNRAGTDDSPTPALQGGSQRAQLIPALTSPPSRHLVCSPKPLPLPPSLRTYTPPQPSSSASNPLCKFNTSQAAIQPATSRSVVSSKLPISVSGPSVAPRPVSASTTASGRFQARPVAFPKPMPAVVSPGMMQLVASSSSTPVEPPKQEGTKFYNTSLKSPSLTPSRATQNPERGAGDSPPAFRVLASVPAADCGGGGAFKTYLPSSSGRSNTVPPYLPSTLSSTLPPTPLNVSPPVVLPCNSFNTSLLSSGEEAIELKPGTPPLYVLPDGTEVSYLNENAMNHYTENCTLEDAHTETHLPPGGDKDTSAAIETPTHGSGTPCAPLGVDTEVSKGAEDTVSSTSIDNLSTHLLESTGTSTCHFEKHKRNSDQYRDTRPARPTSLPLISLSSLVNNTSPASPASLPCDPARSPLGSSPNPDARSFSDIAYPHSPVCGDANFPCVVAADPCVGPQVGISLLTAASSQVRPLPDPSSTPPSHALVSLGPISLVSPDSNFISGRADSLSPLEHKSLPMKISIQEAPKDTELVTELETNRQVLNSEISYPVSLSNGTVHSSANKELELHVVASEGSSRNIKLSSSNGVNEDCFSIMTDKALTRSQSDHELNAQSPQSDDDDHNRETGQPNFSHGIPLIEISNEPRKSSVDEEELRKFMEEIKMSFQNAPSVFKSIDVEDLKPPEYYRSVSRDSMDQEVKESHATVHPDHLAENCGEISDGGDDLTHVEAQVKGNLVSDESGKKTTRETPSYVGVSDSDHHGSDERTGEGKSCGVHAEVLISDTIDDLDDVQSEVEDGEGRDHTHGEVLPRISLQSRMVFTRRCSFPINASPSPPLSSPPASTNPPTPSAGPPAIYTAEVRVVQRSSLPPTPVSDVPHRSMLSPASDESNKRNSVSFNMAAKGWGTYNNFYSPVTFAT